jgi:MFS family permease
MFLLTFSIAGYFLDFPRLYLYGILITLAPLIGELLYQNLNVPHHGWPVTFGLGGIVIIGTGVTLFVRFLHDHPLQPGQPESMGLVE